GPARATPRRSTRPPRGLPHAGWPDVVDQARYEIACCKRLQETLAGIAFILTPTPACRKLTAVHLPDRDPAKGGKRRCGRRDYAESLAPKSRRKSASALGCLLPRRARSSSWAASSRCQSSRCRRMTWPKR